jgi:acetyl-CoA acetyltransferase
MPLNRNLAVIGSAIEEHITASSESLEEILHRIAKAALANAGLTFDDVDGIVVASNDQFDGRAISVMAASGSVGGVDRDILSTPSASEHAFVMGALRVASGQFETQLVMSWSSMEAHSLSEAERLGADPYFHRRLPLDETSAAALQACALRARIPGIEALAAKSKAKTAAPAPGKSSNGRWPLAASMIHPEVSGVVALVLASEDFVDKHAVRNPAWLGGMGWATETGFLGDRDLATAPALVEAARLAYADAGIADITTAIDVAEICDATPYQELLVLDGLSLAPREAWGAAAQHPSQAALPVNPSGGIAAANPVYCTGLIRIAEAADQVRGQARNQVKGARRALAHAASGFAMQYQTVIVFDQKRQVRP